MVILINSNLFYIIVNCNADESLKWRKTTFPDKVSVKVHSILMLFWNAFSIFSAGHDDDDWLFSIQTTWAGAGWEEACWANGT